MDETNNNDIPLPETESVTLENFYTPVEKIGLSNPSELQFFAERNAYLWTVPSSNTYKSYDEALDSATEALSSLEESSIRRLYSSGAVAATQEIRGVMADNMDAADDPVSGGLASWKLEQLEKVKEVAELVPEEAVSAAAVRSLSTYDDWAVGLEDNLIVRDMMVGDITKRVDTKGLAGKTLDFSIAAIVAPRAMVGQLRFAESFNPEAYFNKLKEWRDLPAKDKAAQWPEIEAQLWEAAGNNVFVYIGIANPFVDEADDIWARIDQGVGVTSLVTGLIGGARLYKALKGLNRQIKFRELAARSGNYKVAGRSTASAIKKGETGAIVEGYGIKIPDQDKHFPELVDGVSVPTQQVLVEEATEGLQMTGRTLAEEEQRIHGTVARFIGSGEVKNVTRDGAGFEVTMVTPDTEARSVADVRAQRSQLLRELKERNAELREALSIEATDPGMVDSARIEELTSTVRWLKLQERELDTALKAVKGAPTATHIKGFPTTKEETWRFNWTVDDKTGVLKFEENSPNLAKYMLGSKESTLDGMADEVKTAFGSIVDMQQRKVYADYARFIRNVENWFRKPFIGKLFSKKSKQRVESILLRGDAEQVIYDEISLRNGIKTDNGVIQLNDKEIEAYYGARLAFDNLWYGLNKLQREQLTFAGFSAFNAKYTTKDGKVINTVLFAKAGESDIAFKVPEVGKGFARKVLDARTGDVVDLTTIPNLTEELNKGRLGFVTLRNPFYTADGSQYRHMLVEVDHLGGVKKARQAKEVPYHVLPYRRGYVPKMTTDPIHHVVEMADDLKVNGIKVRTKRTVAGFSSAREARIFINMKDKAYLAKGGDPMNAPSTRMNAVAVDINYRRNPENAETLDLINNSLFKGAFGGHRTDGDFKVGLEERVATRMGPFEAMQRYADYVGRHAPMHQFRENMIRLFLNSTKGMLEVDGDWSSKLIATSDPRYRAAKSMQEWMQSTFAIPTTEEEFFRRFTDHLGLSLDSVIYKNDLGDLRFGAKYTKALQQRLIGSKWANDPVQAAKAFAFDMYLGMFNPIQLLVQTAGIAIPASLHPVESAAAIPRFFALRTLFGMGDFDKAAEAAKAMGIPPKEFKALMVAFRRSGVPDSILAHSDFGHFASSRFGYYSPGLWENIKKSGRVFYNMGELNNRTFAWVLAYERLTRANKWNPAKLRTDKEIIAITEEAFRLGMNMTQANRTKMQSNAATALMTQFWKVTTQFYENSLSSLMGAKKGGAWTRKESLAALFNSTLMLGAANFSIDELFDQYEGWLIDEYKLDPKNNQAHNEFLTYLRGGFLELMSLKGFGYEVDIADRIGVASGINLIYENIAGLIVGAASQEDDKILRALMGASYGLKNRTFNAIGDVMNIFNVAGKNGVVNMAQAEAVVKSLVSITSTGNNYLTAVMWKNANAIVIKSTGEVLGEIPGQQAWIDKAFGLDPLDIEKYYIVDKKDRKYTKLKADISKEIAKIARNLYLSGQYKDPQQQELARLLMHTLVDDLRAYDREEVLANAIKVMDEDTKTERLIVKMIEGLIQSGDPEESAEMRRDVEVLKTLEK